MGLSLATAQTQLPGDGGGIGDDAGDSGGLFSGGLLPNGSILKDAVLPSYDEHLNLTSSVKAAEFTIFTRDESRLNAKTGVTKTVAVLDRVEASDLHILFYNPDQSSRGEIAMARARMIPSKDLTLLTTEEPVSFVSEKMKVDGTGLVFDIDNNRGFLRGPVKAVSKADLRTSMNSKPARQVLAAGALLMASATALPAQEAELTSAEKFAKLRLTPAELEQATKDVTSKRDLVKQASGASEKELEQVKTESDDARITMNSFFQAASLATLLAEPAPATGAVPRPDIKPDPEEMTITSKQGVYLDAVEGLAIFLENVELKRPGFSMTGADEVKIFMAPQKPKETAAVVPEGEKAEKAADSLPKEAKPVPEITPEQAAKMKAAKEAGKKGEGPASEDEMGDVRRIVATGVIVVDYKPEDPTKSPAKASARTMIYDLEKEQIILKGGSPWYIAEDGTKAFLTGENAYIVIKVNGDGDILSVVTHDQEQLQMKMNLKEDPAKKGKDKQPKPENR